MSPIATARRALAAAARRSAADDSGPAPDPESSSGRGRRRRIAVMLAGFLLGVMVLAAVLAPLIAWHDPLDTDVVERLHPPAWSEDGNLTNLLGTDSVGRDLFTRILYGVRSSLVIGFAAMLVGGGVGVTAGILSGYYDGRIAAFVFGRVADVQQAIPFVVLALAVAASVGASFRNLILILGVGSWLFYFRIVRGEVLAIREETYIDAANAIGASNLRILLRHLLPNVFPVDHRDRHAVRAPADHVLGRIELPGAGRAAAQPRAGPDDLRGPGSDTAGVVADRAPRPGAGPDRAGHEHARGLAAGPARPHPADTGIVSHP